jgi:sporulation protein YlmC with PRC-barrel domain
MMLSKMLPMSLALACLLALGLGSSAQQPRTAAEPPASAVPPVVVQPAVQPAVTYRAKQILGTKIMIQNNTAIGTVDDMVFDNAGNLEYLVVNNNDKLVTVPWDAAKWDLKNQTATVAITPEVYRSIPTYTVTTYPDFWAPTYRSQVFKTYGLTPRELRRFDRRNP